MTSKLLSKKEFNLESLYWTKLPYFSKINLQKLQYLVDIFLIRYQVEVRIILGLIIEPKDKSRKYPVVIFNRGGNNINPNTNDMGTTISDLGGLSIFKFVYEKNYVVYTSQLSGYGENSGKDEFGGEDLNDILEIKKLIELNTICDSNRVGMLGYSRGGMMSYLSLINSKWLKTIAVVGAPTNLIRNAIERPGMQQVFDEAFGGSEEEKIKRSILFNTEKIPIDTNILMIHGKSDDRVSYLDSTELSEKLSKKGINNKLAIFDNGSHSLFENKKERDDLILSWFKAHL